MYKIHYLPLALDDLKEIVRYIVYKLEAPRAAERLLSKIKKEVLKITDNPYRCRIYTLAEKFKYEYRVLRIDHYSLFYAVKNGKLEIHRVINTRRDIPHIINTMNKDA